MTRVSFAIVLVTLSLLPGLHWNPCWARFIAGASSCTAAGLSELLASCLAAVGWHVVECCWGGGCEGSGGGLFWSRVGSGRILDRHGLRGFGVSGFRCVWFSTLCVALPHSLMTDKLIDLI